MAQQSFFDKLNTLISANMHGLVDRALIDVRFFVRISGELLPYFTPSRGFRQGDPVSPYLFLLCAEGFSSLLKYYNGGVVDMGLRVSYRSPWVTHLLFVWGFQSWGQQLVRFFHCPPDS